jgi:hypothetical protein
MTSPIYARDYATSSRLTELAYKANLLQKIPSGLTGNELAARLRQIPEVKAIFANDAEIDAFASRHSFVKAQGVAEKEVGADVVAFRIPVTNALSPEIILLRCMLRS